jgi:hypothetical protein
MNADQIKKLRWDDSDTKVTSSSSYQQQHVFFRVGKLRFGFHGSVGILALVFTTLATYLYYCQEQQQQQDDRPTTRIAILIFVISQVLNAVLATQAASLLPQVPDWTEIMPGIVAPHKEAFRRTMAVLHYLVARVTLATVLKSTFLADVMMQMGMAGSSAGMHDQYQGLLLANQDLCYNMHRYLCCAVLVWFWWPLVPSASSQWRNGNTWIFVLPIFVGVTGDLGQYMFMTSTSTAGGDIDIVPVHFLLQTQLLGLVLAFWFTLAFRNYVSMSTVYAGAALGVWKILHNAFYMIQAAAAASAATATVVGV